jgi:NTP pyrophosphatase (non-canonical NTP hydrolase)
VPSLEEARRKIGDLVVAKGFGNTKDDIPSKLLFAFIELGEAGDSWKKGRPSEETAEELVDVIFYVLDASRLIAPDSNMDEVFEKKWEKNMGRPFQYGEGFRKK